MLDAVRNGSLCLDDLVAELGPYREDPRGRKVISLDVAMPTAEAELEKLANLKVTPMLQLAQISIPPQPPKRQASVLPPGMGEVLKIMLFE
jgi:hypothetical protein